MSYTPSDFVDDADSLCRQYEAALIDGKELAEILRDRLDHLTSSNA